MASSNNPSTTDPATPPTASRNNGGGEHQTEEAYVLMPIIPTSLVPRNSKSSFGPIRRVLPLLRSHSSNKGVFDPRVVSIGPSHHGKTELQPAEKIKPLVMQLFLHPPPMSLRGQDINRNTPSRSRIINYDDIHQLVKARVKYARSYYDDGSTDSYSDDEFTLMMILDGFFVLALLQFFPSDEIGFELLVNSYLGRNAIGLLQNNVTFLVENQIPFPILELLTSSVFQDPNKGMEILTAYFSYLFSWRIAVPKGCGFNYAQQVKGSDIIARSPNHLMEVFWFYNCALDHQQQQQQQQQQDKKQQKDVLYYVGSATELKGMGINVAPSSSLSPSAVAFKSGFLTGRLELPPCFVSNDVNRHLANMMAYEVSSPHLELLPATSYITFMKSLLNTPEDVRDLRSKYVLFARGISDEKVLEIVQGTPNFGINDYYVFNHVKQRIHEHCNRRWKTWMAELINDYFKNPWNFTALVAATFLLVLTFIQTYFTVKPRH